VLVEEQVNKHEGLFLRLSLFLLFIGDTKTR